MTPLWRIEASSGVFEVATQLLPCRVRLRRALKGAKQRRVALGRPEHLVHDAPGFADGAREVRGASDRRFVLGCAKRRKETGAGCNKTRHEPLRGPGERDDLLLEFGPRRLDVGGQTLGAAAQALGPVISRGTTHCSNCSAVSRPSSSAASLRVVPST